MGFIEHTLYVHCTCILLHSIRYIVSSVIIIPVHHFHLVNGKIKSLVTKSENKNFHKCIHVVLCCPSIAVWVPFEMNSRRLSVYLLLIWDFNTAEYEICAHNTHTHTHSCSLSMWGPIYFLPPKWGRVCRVFNTRKLVFNLLTGDQIMHITHNT